MFPDSQTENIERGLQLFIWMSLYADSDIGNELFGKPDLRKIQVLNNELNELYSLVDEYKKEDTKLSIHESHKDIAEICHDISMTNKNINVYNIDFHDDCYDSGHSEINCGNWAKLLINRNIINSVSWVKRSDSQCENSEIIGQVYGSIHDLYYNPTIKEGIDYIFICRSGMWTPPHLDDEFVKLVYTIAGFLDVDEPAGVRNINYRWTSKMQNEIINLANQQRIFRKR